MNANMLIKVLLELVNKLLKETTFDLTSFFDNSNSSATFKERTIKYAPTEDQETLIGFKSNKGTKLNKGQNNRGLKYP